jgi:NADH-quinone oxidoreductase subunit M
MSSFPWLTTIGLIPLIGAAVVALLPASLAGRARQISLGFSLATLVVAIGAALQFNTSSTQQFQLSETHSWIPQFGVSYAVGVDGIALVLIMLAVILAPVCILAAWNDVPEVGRRTQNYFALMLVLETFMVGVFAATDVFLFYVFFEAMLIPVYFLIGSFGGPQRQYAAVKFLLFSLLGGLVMLVAVIALGLHGPGGPQDFLVTNLTGLHLDQTTERLLFLGFFFAFAVKAPMFPVHTWLPDAAAEAPPATSVLLVGVLDKVGTFGMIRFCLPLFPEASKWATPAIIVLAVISIVYGALLAIGQTDVMRLIAFTSISHFGFIVLGIFAMTSVVTPVLAGVFLVAGLSSLALPGMASFISEFLVLVGTFQRYKVAAAIATTGIVLAALYILLMYQRMMTGPKPELAERPADLSRREKWVVAPLIAAFIVLGFYPKPVLDVINPAVQTTMQQVGVTDPAPTHGTAADGSAK